MMVGGWLIQIKETRPGVTQLWCADRNGDELAVDVETASAMPLLGDEVWWQSGWVYWDRDRRKLRKISNSYDPTKEGRR